MRAGQDNNWRAILGEDRQVIGDFACLLVAHLGILASEVLYIPQNHDWQT